MRLRKLRPMIKNWFGSINTQLIVSYSLLIIVVIGCIVVSVAVPFTLFTQQNMTLNFNAMEIISESVESRISEFRKLTTSMIVNDPIICAALKDEGSYDNVPVRLSGLYLYGLQQRYVINTDLKVLDPLYFDDSEKILRLAGMYDFLDANKNEFFSAPHAFPFPDESGGRISYFYTLRDPENYYETYGYSMLIISSETLFNSRADLLGSMYEEFYVVDGAGNLIYHTGDESSILDSVGFIRATMLDTYSSSHFDEGGKSYFHTNISSYASWHLVGVISNYQKDRSIVSLISTSVMFGLVGIIFVILLSRGISKRITIPVSAINKSMKMFESGDLPDKLDMRTSGEMSELVDGFNHMIDDIKHHVEVIVREQEEKKTAEVAALRYQLESLQNQINPHFLYNTLNIISFLALDGKSEEIREFNQSLIALLRATLSNTNDTVTISQELRILEAYVQIMEYRYPKMFTVKTRCEPALLECKIPKLILQPIVENAMIHGIFPTGESGVITVVITRKDDHLRVIVRDNGMGMDKEKLSGLFDSRKGFTSIGIRNVNDRLVLCYGEDAHLRVDSFPGTGTSVEFYIPMIFDD